MAVTIDWAESIIYVGRDDLTLVQSTPTEIRELDINAFRLDLKALEASVAGMPYLKTNTHNTEVSLGGITFARVVEILEPYTITFEDGQYAVNLVGANSNIGDKTNVNQVSVRSSNAAGLISSPAIEFASFNGGVIVDVNSPYSGTLFPRGTEQMKVNNIVDALLIAEYRGFSKIYLHSDITLGAEAHLNNFVLQGESHVNTEVYIEAAAECQDISIVNCNVTGVLDGGTHINGCVAGDLVYVNGHIHNCGLYGTITLSGNENAVIADCYTIDEDNPLIIDMGGSGQDLAMPNYSGKATIKNLTSSSEEVGIGLNAGKIILDETITAGTISVAGAGLVADNSTADIVNIDGLISKETISKAVWDEPIANHLQSGSTGLSVGTAQFAGFVTIDVSGSSGTIFPIGTQRVPVNNIEDAVVIAEARGINKLQFISNFTFHNTISIAQYEFYGSGGTDTTLTFEYGSVVGYCKAFNTTVTGFGFGLTEFTNCILYNYTSSGLAPSSASVSVTNCLIRDHVTLPSNFTGKLAVIDCYSIGASESSDRATLDCGGANFKALFKGYHGSFKIKNNTHVDTVFSIDIDTGKLTLDSTVTAGLFKIRGVGLLEDNSTGTSINTEGLMSKDTVSKAIWDEPIEDHLIEGTTGLSIGTAQFDGFVHIDAVNGQAGTTFPLGTVAVPVNNLSDAVSIAAVRGINKLKFYTDYTFPNGTYIENYILYGLGKTQTTFTFEMGCVLLNCRLYDAKGTGTVIGTTGFDSCHLDNLGNYSPVANASDIFVSDCIISGTTLLPSLYKGTVFALNCWAAPDENGDPPVFDMNGGSFNLQGRNYSGFLKIKNCVDSTNDIRMFLNSGGLILDETVSGGDFIVTGVGTLVDDSIEDSVGSIDINVEGLMSKDTISDAVLNTSLAEYTDDGTVASGLRITNFGGVVSVNVISGTSGTVYPKGTIEFPVNNIDDAITIAEDQGFDTIRIHGDYHFDNTVSISDYYIKGDSKQSSHFTFDTGSVLANCQFAQAHIEGDVLGVIGYFNCHINDLAATTEVVSTARIVVQDTLIQGRVGVPSTFAGEIDILDCWCLPTNGAAPVFDMNDAAFSLQVRNLSGFAIIKNCTQPNDVRIFLNNGGIVLESTVTMGTFVFTGVGNLTDNSVEDTTGTLTISTDALVNTDTIASSVWDEPIASHMLPDTTGHQMYHQAYSGIVYIDTVNGASGTAFPTGTTYQPCNNLTDALFIADTHFMDTIHVVGTLVIDGEDITGKTIAADSSVGNMVTITSMTNTGTCYFKDLTIGGALSGSTRFTTCVLGTLTGFDGGAKNSLLTGDVTITGNGANYFTDCDTYLVNMGYKTIDVGNHYLNLIRCRGSFELANYTGESVIATDFAAGLVKIANTCVSGIIGVRGLVTLVDESGPGCTVVDHTVTEEGIANSVWDATTEEHTEADSFGELLARSIGLMQENHYLDNTVYTSYNGQKLLASGRIRTYTDATSVGTDADVLATYLIQAVYSGDELDTYKVIKQ